MACALPGNFLLLRRQSMMGDALSHTVLPGIVIAFLAGHWLQSSGWLASGTFGARSGDVAQHTLLFVGAMLLGVFSAVLTEWVQKLGRVESSAALGVVFTTLFAFGLLLLRAAADDVHIDPDCVLYGNIELAVLDTWGQTNIPRAAVINGSVLLVNLALVVVFYKELRIATFDPALATTMGINARLIHYGLMAITAATLVSAFESVGSILVIAVLIVPAATAYLLTDRLSRLLMLSLLFASLSALGGHVMAITLPPVIFGPLGFTRVESASTAGMTAVAAGMMFLAAMLLGPRYGIFSRWIDRTRLGLRVVREDVLGLLYRQDELAVAGVAGRANINTVMAASPGWLRRLAIWQLCRRGQIEVAGDEYRLTAAGSRVAQELVRSHRLWRATSRSISPYRTTTCTNRPSGWSTSSIPS